MPLSRSDQSVRPDCRCVWLGRTRRCQNQSRHRTKTILGQPELILTDAVLIELKKIDEGRKGLLLELLTSRAKIIHSDDSYTDDGLIRLSIETGYPVLTVDRELKRRLISVSCSYVEVTAGRTLRLVD